jgi:3-hydroxyacyl-CoA dehydrogenase/enoyl-CoA hydratase/carnithine racemase
MMSARPVQIDRRVDGIAVVIFHLTEGSVNKITPEVTSALAEVLDELTAEPPRGAVFTSGRDHFCVGADVNLIAAIGDEDAAREASRRGQDLFARLSTMGFPTVVAVAGNCLGGGYEWALACHRIVAAADAKVGLPEVRLGILPGWGGTQRLTRRVGFGPAVEMMASGRTLNAQKALARGAVDKVVPVGEVVSAAVSLAAELGASHTAGSVPSVRRRGLMGTLVSLLPPVRNMVFAQVKKAVLQRAGRHYPAPPAIVAAVEAAVAGDEARGFARERDLFASLAVTDVSRHLVQLFLLNSEAKSWYGDDEAAVAEDPRTVAVLGAGVMGAGIAYLAASRGLQVILRDVADEPLAAGVKRIHKSVAKQVERGRLDETRAAALRDRVQATIDATDLAAAHLIIEAVVENMAVKKKVLAEAAHKAPDAVLATNTSALSVSEMAADLPRPEVVGGLHFFNPVEKMPLVEIIAPSTAAPATVGALVKVARGLGKVPIKVADSPGFLVNRILSFYLAEAIRLVEEGHDLAALDRRMKNFGMPMGPCALLDQIGLDVADHVTGTLRDAFGDRMSASDLLPRMVADGRTGSKGGGGFYSYGADKPQPDDEGVRRLMATPPTATLSPGEEEDRRLLYPMISEACRCLDEGVVSLPGEIDLAMVMGIGWPPFTGGLLRWADGLGLANVVASLDDLAGRHGAHLAPPEGLRRRAAAGDRFYLPPS